MEQHIELRSPNRKLDYTYEKIYKRAKDLFQYDLSIESYRKLVQYAMETLEKYRDKNGKPMPGEEKKKNTKEMIQRAITQLEAEDILFGDESIKLKENLDMILEIGIELAINAIKNVFDIGQKRLTTCCFN